MKFSIADLFLCYDCLTCRFPTTASDISENKQMDTTSKSVDIDEVLFFMVNSLSKGTLQQLKTVAVAFFTDSELAVAKEKLYRAAERLKARDLKRLKR